MIITKTPYFETNKNWYYYDQRAFRLKLTDEAPQEAIDSYIEHYCLLEGLPVTNTNWDELREKISQRAQRDIAEYIKYKNTYKFTIEKNGLRVLGMEYKRPE